MHTALLYSLYMHADNYIDYFLCGTKTDVHFLVRLPAAFQPFSVESFGPGNGLMCPETRLTVAHS